MLAGWAIKEGVNFRGGECDEPTMKFRVNWDPKAGSKAAFGFLRVGALMDWAIDVQRHANGRSDDGPDIMAEGRVFFVCTDAVW